MPSSTIPASGGGGLRPRYQKFTSSGTFTLPDGYGAANPLLITIQVIGGGGGGKGVAPTGSAGFRAGFFNYFGAFIRNVGPLTVNKTNVAGDGAGGSGGIAATQMYLTANLTITVGAAGIKSLAAYDTAFTGDFNPGGSGNSNQQSSPNTSYAQVLNPAGGTGGTTTAGSVQATGGIGGSHNGQQRGVRLDNVQNGNTISQHPERTPDGSSSGAGGTPAGTAGDATPLLGTIAGGSSSTTPIRGSFGIGGINTDLTVSTGVEGTGGGRESIAASGAVIITWWQ